MTTIAALGLLIIGGLIWYWRRRPPARSRGLRAMRPAASVQRATQKQLLRLLNGDQRTAERLLSQVRVKYPGQAESWYWEKVIFDIQRDRHAS